MLRTQHLKPTAALIDRLFAFDDGIRSVLIVGPEGEHVDFRSRARQPTPAFVTENLAGPWIRAIATTIQRTAPAFGFPHYLHIRYAQMDMYGFAAAWYAIVFTTRRTFPESKVLPVMAFCREHLSRYPPKGAEPY